MGDDDIRFVFDLGGTPTNAEPRAKPDTSFRIGGQLSAPASLKSQPAFPEISTPRSTPTSTPATVTHPARAALHIALRIPRKMLDDIDAIARERNTSMSQVIRTILANAIRRRRRSTGVKR